MSVSFGAIGTGANGSTSVAPSYPSGIAQGQYLTCVVTSGATNSETPSTPGGWTLLATGASTDGSFGVDTGPRRVTVFGKVADGTESGTLTVSITNGNTCRGTIQRWTNSSGFKGWLVEAQGGNDSTSGTGFSAATAAITWAVGDGTLVAVGQRVDTATNSSQSLTASGITFGTMTNRADTAVTTGNDHRHVVFTLAAITSGSGSQAPTFAYTGSAACSGGLVVVRIREQEVVFNVAPSANLAVTGTLSASGDLDPHINLVQSGSTAVAGTVSIAGDVQIVAPPAGGFNAPMLLTTLGSGAVPEAALNLAPSALAVVGTVTASGDLDPHINLVQSGSTAVVGVLTASGDIQNSIAFNLAPSTLAVAGTVAVAGTLDPHIDLVASTLAVSGTVTAAGDLQSQSALNISAAAIAVGGTLTAIGTTIGVGFGLVPAAVAVSGTLAAAGTIGVGFQLVPATLSVSGTITSSGDVQVVAPSAGGFVSPVLLGVGGHVGALDVLNLVASPVGLSGTLTTSGALQIAAPPAAVGGFASPILFGVGGAGIVITTQKDLVTSLLGIQGAVSATGTLGVGFSLSPVTLPLSGTPTIAGDIHIVPFASFDLTTSTIAISGDVTIEGNVDHEEAWEFESPLYLNEISGALTVSAALDIFGPVGFDLNTGAVSLLGVMTAVGDTAYAVGLNLSQSAVSMIAAITVAGDLKQAINLVPSTLPVAGTVGTTGNIGTAITFDLAGASLAVNGAVGASGVLGYGIDFDIGSASLSITGSPGVGGDLDITTNILLDIVGAVVGIVGSVGVTGEVDVMDFDLSVLVGPAISGELSVLAEFYYPHVFDIQSSTVSLIGAISMGSTSFRTDIDPTTTGERTLKPNPEVRSYVVPGEDRNVTVTANVRVIEFS